MSTLETKTLDLHPDTRGTPKFTLFPKLPLEIRCEIWRAAMFPRIIEMPLNCFRCRGGCDPPTLAFVNEESKAETKKFYTKLPLTRYGTELSPYNIYFEIDVVCCSQPPVCLSEEEEEQGLASELPNWIGGIQRLGFPLESFIDHRRPRGSPLRLYDFPGHLERRFWGVIHSYFRKAKELIFFLENRPNEEEGTNILEEWTEYWSNPHPEWLARAMEERNSWYGQLADHEVMDSINGSLSDFQEKTGLLKDLEVVFMRHETYRPRRDYAI